MTAKELVEKIRKKKTLDNEWFVIREEVLLFLNEEHPKEEKEMFSPLGYLEVVSMMCDALDKKEK